MSKPQLFGSVLWNKTSWIEPLIKSIVKKIVQYIVIIVLVPTGSVWSIGFRDVNAPIFYYRKWARWSAGRPEWNPLTTRRWSFRHVRFVPGRRRASTSAWSHARHVRSVYILFILSKVHCDCKCTCEGHMYWYWFPVVLPFEGVPMLCVVSQRENTIFWHE